MVQYKKNICLTKRTITPASVSLRKKGSLDAPEVERIDIPSRPDEDSIMSRLWDNVYGAQTRDKETFISPLKQDVERRFSDGDSSAKLKSIVAELLGEELRSASANAVAKPKTKAKFSQWISFKLGAVFKKR